MAITNCHAIRGAKVSASKITKKQLLSPIRGAKVSACIITSKHLLSPMGTDPMNTKKIWWDADGKDKEGPMSKALYSYNRSIQ